jgi:cell fate (sporulation/competence/biofilm development) regulator YmcA (YheA/YmcA/DUF963 family)
MNVLPNKIKQPTKQPFHAVHLSPGTLDPPRALQLVQDKILAVESEEAELLPLVGEVRQAAEQYLQLLQGMQGELALLVEDALLNKQHWADEVRVVGKLGFKGLILSGFRV